jgi:predicted KAP-like P-loop ATPase
LRNVDGVTAGATGAFSAAMLIAATETRPPLAIALIGDWGAGKSSVMLQMEAHISVLVGRAQNNPGLTAWAESVRQVRFNAWHYSDDQLWAGLVSRLFEMLASPQGQAEGMDSGADRSSAEETRRPGDCRTSWLLSARRATGWRKN